jgi:hypothetical protein
VDGAVRNLSKKRASRTRLCLHGQQQAPPNRLSHRLCCLGKSIYSFRANEMFGSGDGVEPSHPDDAGKHMAKVAFLIRARSVGSSPPRPTINLQHLCGNSHFCFSLEFPIRPSCQRFVNFSIGQIKLYEPPARLAATTTVHGCLLSACPVVNSTQRVVSSKENTSRGNSTNSAFSSK